MNLRMTDKPSKPASTKLELTWPGKQNRPRLEPRILLEDKALSYHAAPPVAADLVEQAGQSHECQCRRRRKDSRNTR